MREDLSTKPEMQAEHTFEISVPNLKPGTILLLPLIYETELHFKEPQSGNPVGSDHSLVARARKAEVHVRNRELVSTSNNSSSLLLPAFMTQGQGRRGGGGGKETLQLGKNGMRNPLD